MDIYLPDTGLLLQFSCSPSVLLFGPHRKRYPYILLAGAEAHLSHINGHRLRTGIVRGIPPTLPSTLVFTAQLWCSHRTSRCTRGRIDPRASKSARSTLSIYNIHRNRCVNTMYTTHWIKNAGFFMTMLILLLLKCYALTQSGTLLVCRGHRVAAVRWHKRFRMSGWVDTRGMR